MHSLCPTALHSKRSRRERGGGTLPLLGSHLYEWKNQGKEREVFSSPVVLKIEHSV